ncbi:hypothetical protein, partial [Enterobacter hormaechei]|uniref:hypothetical protein n=1 Tax=Enterobacter hormaechei TaxID=158836 RepID=UPI0013D1EF86
MSLTLIVGLPTLGIAAWAMMHFGVLGLATTMAVANAVQTVISIVMAKWLLGLDAVARPLNPLRLYRALM